MRGSIGRPPSEQRLVERAKIILLSHEGLTVETIARQQDTRPARVSQWRRRFAQDRLSALAMLDQSAPEGYSQWNGPLLAEAPARFSHGVSSRGAGKGRGCKARDGQRAEAYLTVRRAR